MKHYGTKVSNGLGLGKCVIINDVVPEVNDSKIDSTSIDNEILKVNNSIDECIKSYENIINSLVDEDLKQLCEEKGVKFIDASSIMSEGNYEPDGIHFGVTCIKKWLDLFIQQANL